MRFHRWLPFLMTLAATVGVAGCRSHGSSCATACDCTPGYACHDGRCASGTVAVFCCDACPAAAPSEQMCQARSGAIGSCGATRQRECGAQPCCGNPPEPCGQWLARKHDGG